MESKTAATPSCCQHKMPTQVAAEQVPVTGIYEMMVSIGQNFAGMSRGKVLSYQSNSRAHVYLFLFKDVIYQIWSRAGDNPYHLPPT